MIRTCAYDSNCGRIPAPFHAMCDAHERAVMSSAFGPVSWTERRELGVLPTLVVGGVALEDRALDLPPRPVLKAVPPAA